MFTSWASFSQPLTLRLSIHFTVVSETFSFQKGALPGFPGY